VSIGEYVSALRTKWVTVVACAVLAVVAAAGVSALTSPSYMASTRLFVNTTAGETASDAYQGSLSPRVESPRTRSWPRAKRSRAGWSIRWA